MTFERGPEEGRSGASAPGGAPQRGEWKIRVSAVMEANHVASGPW